AVGIVSTILTSSRQAQTAADVLAKRACRRWLDQGGGVVIDDITVIVSCLLSTLYGGIHASMPARRQVVASQNDLDCYPFLGPLTAMPAVHDAKKKLMASQGFTPQ
ncbi:hypothetical protein FOZ63_022401, partial [Perkinsus olseni]